MLMSLKDRYAAQLKPTTVIVLLIGFLKSQFKNVAFLVLLLPLHHCSSPRLDSPLLLQAERYFKKKYLLK
jgi:hypothetical protein